MSSIDRRSVLMMSLLGATMGLPAARAQTAPNGYPDIYREIIAAAEREGSLLIYSIMSPENWRPVIEGFTKLSEDQGRDAGSAGVTGKLRALSGRA
jgi:iron(III) transport system substrate-binding protein